MPKKNEFSPIQQHEWDALSEYYKEMLDIEAQLLVIDKRLSDSDFNCSYETEAWDRIHYTVGELSHLYLTFVDAPSVSMPKPLHLDEDLDIRTAIARIKSWCVAAEYSLRDAEKPKLTKRAIKVARCIYLNPGQVGWDIDDELEMAVGTAAKVMVDYLEPWGFFNGSPGYYPPGYTHHRIWESPIKDVG